MGGLSSLRLPSSLLGFLAPVRWYIKVSRLWSKAPASTGYLFPKVLTSLDPLFFESSHCNHV